MTFAIWCQDVPATHANNSSFFGPSCPAPGLAPADNDEYQGYSEVGDNIEHSLALLFFGIGMKTDFSSPVATAEFSKFVDILSAALSQHHLLEFEIAQLEFHHLHY